MSDNRAISPATSEELLGFAVLVPEQAFEKKRKTS